MAVATVVNIADGEAPPVGTLLWAKRTMGYGGQQLDRGQVFKCKGLTHDATLYRLGYVALVRGKTYACRECGAEFVDQMLRDTHGKHAHEKRTFTPPPAPEKDPNETMEQYRNRLDEWALMAGRRHDAEEERRERHESEVAPLNLEKTTASRS